MHMHYLVSERYIVKLLDALYLPLLPPTSTCVHWKNSHLILMINQRVGINMLKKILSDLSEKLGLVWRCIIL